VTSAGVQAGGAPGLAARGSWSVETRRDDEAFGSLAEDWEALYASCSAATPFQSYGWLESWWREYGSKGRLRLVLVRRDGRLVAAAPLMLRRRGPWRVLLPLGGDQTDFQDILVDDAYAPTACQMVAQALVAEPGWHVLDVPQARPGAAAEHLYASWAGPRWRTRGSVCLEIPAGSLPDLLARLPAGNVHRVRTKLRKVEAAGIEARCVGGTDVEAGVHALLRLHEQQWRGRGINEEHLQPRFRRHLARSVNRMVDRGQAALVQYWLAGRLVATDLELVGHRFVGAYLVGFEPGLRRQVDVAMMMTAQAVVLAERRQRPVLSLLRGTEPYKMRFHPVAVRNRRLLLARRGGPGTAAGYAWAVRARTALADATRDRLPWLRRARYRIRQAAARLAARWR